MVCLAKDGYGYGRRVLSNLRVSHRTTSDYMVGQSGVTIISGSAVSLPLGPCLNLGSLGLKVGIVPCYEAVVLNYAVSPVKGFGIWGPFFFFFYNK